MRVAVFGLFQNEYFFIPYWQNYYGKLVGLENLYAIGDLNNDSSMKLFDKSVNLINYSPEVHANFEEHVQLVLQWQRQLLASYDVVVFAEADQYFIPNPYKYNDLIDYLSNNGDPYIKVCGYNVIHMIESEPVFDPKKGILSQRNFWYRFPLEDKLFVVRQPVQSYTWGFHVNTVPDVPADPDLFNVHMHSCDFNVTNSRRNTKTNVGKWHPTAGPGRAGFHTWVQDDTLKQQWYNFSNQFGLQTIPEKFKDKI